MVTFHFVWICFSCGCLFFVVLVLLFCCVFLVLVLEFFFFLLLWFSLWDGDCTVFLTSSLLCPLTGWAFAHLICQFVGSLQRPIECVERQALTGKKAAQHLMQNWLCTGSSGETKDVDLSPRSLHGKRVLVPPHWLGCLHG